jgi:blue copper oxidase
MFIRFRVLNGSSQRTFNIGLNNNQAFYQIASDGGLLSAPVQLTRLLLATGERAELLIDFTSMDAQTTFLKSFASELPNGIYGATNPGMGAGLTLNNYKPSALNGTDFNIIKFVVRAKTSNPITTIPSKLATVNPILASTSNITMQLTFTPATMGPTQLNGTFLINNAAFDMMVVNYIIPFDNTEIWELTNQSAISHPFHIHDVQFYILTRNGVAPAANEQGRKDVVLVNPQEVVRFIAKFENFANDKVPYMYHCHLLTHEDGGMMGQFIVSKPI